MRRVALILTLLLAPTVLLAQRATQIQLATILPANSLWDKSLRQMGADWEKATDGRVRMRMFPGGAQGDESTIIRRLKLGTPQAAAFSQPGLAEIDDAFNVFGIPFFFDSDEEMRYVLEKLEPMLTQRLEKHGLVFLNWGHGGWAHVFTTSAVRTLDDIKRHKIFTTAGGDKMVQWYKQNGFQPVPLPITEVLLGLNTGLISAYPSPPYLALLLQWYSKAPYMLDVLLGPVIGATVITEAAWKRIGAEDQEEILEICGDLEDRLMTDVPAQERSSIEEMKKRGLTVATLDAAAQAGFHAAAEKLTASMRGWMVPADVYDAAFRERNAFRAGGSGFSR